MTKLKAVPEGDGTLLDHTLILWCNELAVGNIHRLTDRQLLQLALLLFDLLLLPFQLEQLLLRFLHL